MIILKKIVCILFCLLIVAGCQSNQKNKENETQTVSTLSSHITYKQLQTYFSEFECGDIINLENTHYLSNLAIPGRWKHTLIYLGTLDQVKAKITPDSSHYSKIIEKYHTGKEVFVLDANSTGVKIRPFDAMANLDEESYLKSLVCYRLKKDQNFVQAFIDAAMNYCNTPYDFEMESGDEALYCSELIYFALYKNGIELTDFQDIFGHRILTPTNLILELENKDIVQKILILENDK